MTHLQPLDRLPVPARVGWSLRGGGDVSLGAHGGSWGHREIAGPLLTGLPRLNARAGRKHPEGIHSGRATA